MAQTVFSKPASGYDMAKPLPLNGALDQVRPSGIRRFSRLAAETPGCISLTLGEPGEDTPDAIVSRVQEDLDARMTHYPPNNGHAFLREGIARDCVRRGLSYDADDIVVTSGATEALFVTMMGLLNPGDEVVIPTPAFILYESIARLCRACPVLVDTEADSFQLAREKLEAAVTRRTKAIVLASPNNPTGSILDEESLDAAAFVAREHGVYIICDDVYRKLVYEAGYEGFAVRHPELRDRVVVVDSFSKPYAMTGWRLGWLAAAAPIVAKLSMVHQFAVSSVPSFIQHAALEALSYDTAAFMEAYRRRRGLVVDALHVMGLDLVEPQGAFYAFPPIRPFGLTSEEFCERAIEEAGVALVPGSLFGGEGHVRLSYACDDETLNEGLIRLASFIRALKARS